ncbi:hypothetical protein LguiA_026492 [Lonicera macranthoides]
MSMNIITDLVGLKLKEIIADKALDFLVLSWWEVQVTIGTAAFVIVAYWFFTFGLDNAPRNSNIDDKDKYKCFSTNGAKSILAPLVLKQIGAKQI